MLYSLLKDSGGTVSVLFLGDLNSSPKSGAYQLISSGHVPANSVHWYTGRLNAAVFFNCLQRTKNKCS